MFSAGWFACVFQRPRGACSLLAFKLRFQRPIARPAPLPPARTVSTQVYERSCKSSQLNPYFMPRHTPQSEGPRTRSSRRHELRPRKRLIALISYYMRCCATVSSRHRRRKEGSTCATIFSNSKRLPRRGTEGSCCSDVLQRKRSNLWHNHPPC